MNSQNIFDGVTDIRDDLIQGAKEAPKKRKRWKKRHWMGAVAALLAVAIIGGILLRSGSDLTAYAIAEAKYPKMAPYPDMSAGYNEAKYEAWWNDVIAQRRDLGDISSLQSFFVQSTQAFLSGEAGENRVYSPLNVYMALAMTAQLTDGESRAQILELLGSGSMEELRKQANDVWNSNYHNDGALTSILASSLWLNQNVEFNQSTMDVLAEDFYASSYQGEMGSKEFNQALQSWLNEQTGGLLKEQAGDIKLNSQTILALATTVYYRAKWHDEFFEKYTTSQTFHTPAGDVETDFMHQGGDQNYFWGEKFAAISKPFDQGGSMWFLLPDEGVSPEELLEDGEAMDFLFTANKNDWEKKKFLIVNKAIPKFDISSQFDLEDGLRALGITDIFDPTQSDFSPMAANLEDSIVLSASHAARVAIDEEGCIAAAFTMMVSAGGAEPPDEEVDFVLNRPFLFCITGNSGLPLFVGIVNYPTEK